MGDRNSFYYANFIREYGFARSSLRYVGIECFIIAAVIGILKINFWWGLGTFLLLLFLYAIPIVGGILSIALSMTETIVVCSFIAVSSAPASLTCVLTLIMFVVLVEMHRVFGAISDEGVFGISLVISECMIISWIVWYITKLVPLSVALCVILIIFMFIPKVRVVELVALPLGISVFAFLLMERVMSMPYAIIIAILIFSYIGYKHKAVYDIIDYSGMKVDKYNRSDAFVEFEVMKNKLYNEYPELPKEYHYFKVGVCKTENNRISFETDWISYLYYLNNSSEFCTFNQFFEKKELYKSRSYNIDYALSWKQQQNNKEL